MLSQNLKVFPLNSGRVGIFGVVASDIPILKQHLGGELRHITLKDGGVRDAFATLAHESEARKCIADYGTPFSLDWHNEHSCRDFADMYLPRSQDRFIRLVAQLRWEEQGEGKASPFAHRLAERLSSTTRGDLAAWLEKELA